MKKLPIFAAVALLPAMTGPLEAATGASLTIGLCNGGTVKVPLGGPSPPGTASTPCCAKGCRGETERKMRKPL